MLWQYQNVLQKQPRAATYKARMYALEDINFLQSQLPFSHSYTIFFLQLYSWLTLRICSVLSYENTPLTSAETAGPYFSETEISSHLSLPQASGAGYSLPETTRTQEKVTLGLLVIHKGKKRRSCPSDYPKARQGDGKKSSKSGQDK